MIAGGSTMMALNTPHIHIIDDELSICTGIQGILETNKLYVSYSLTYQEGLQYLDQHHDVDIILLDVNLRADITGIDVLPMIKTRHKYSQVIMFTSYDRLEIGLECMKRGAMDFMTKPLNEERFLHLVDAAVEKKRLEQVKDLYFDMVVHDLKNPLQCISASFEILQEQLTTTLSPLQQRLFETAGSGVHQIKMMIGNILGITSFEKGSLTARRESFAIVTTINNVVELYETVEVTFDDYLPTTIRSDKDLYTRILTNIVSNAVRFARIGTAVTVSCTFDTLDRLFITSVRNQGSYLNEEQREGVFNKFTAVSRSTGAAQGQNYGLGLTFSKMAVEALDGSIGVESDEQSQTTTFIFSVKDFSIV
jgi:K+-sensing histidine kinase KdpD